jgi:Na+-transporting NADH:ubiquinone oxidoreductase subunit NqrC
MKEKEKISAITQMIANERWLIRWSVILAICFFCSGLVASIALAIAGSNAFQEIGDVVKGIPAIAGAGISIFSMKDFLSRKNKIVMLQYLADQFSKSRSPEVVKEANELYRELIKNIISS